MSLVPEIPKFINIDNSVELSLESDNRGIRLEWIPITEISSIQIGLYYTIRDNKSESETLKLLRLCTQTFVSEFAKNTRSQRTSTGILWYDIPYGSKIEQTHQTWRQSPIEDFITVTFDMDSAHVEYFDTISYGAFVVTKNLRWVD